MAAIIYILIEKVEIKMNSRLEQNTQNLLNLPRFKYLFEINRVELIKKGVWVKVLILIILKT